MLFWVLLRRVITLAIDNIFVCKIKCVLLACAIFSFTIPASAEEVFRSDSGLKSNAFEQRSGKPTANINLGGGYSTKYGAAAFAELKETNLFNKDYKFHARYDWAEDRNNIYVYLGKPSGVLGAWDPGLDLSYNQVKYDEASYTIRTLSASPYLSYQLDENNSFTASYFYRHFTLKDVSSGLTPIIAREEGSSVASGFGLSWTFKNLDDVRDPRNGVLVRMGVRQSGVGGDENWTKVVGEVNAFNEIYPDVVASIGAQGGYVHSHNNLDVNSAERFYLGGSNLIGFANAGVGPRDVRGDETYSLGGNQFAAIHASLDFPIATIGTIPIRGGVFWDAGSVWGLDNKNGFSSVDAGLNWRASYGFSIKADTPLGRLQFNIANPYQREAFDRIERFSFSINQKF